MSDVKPNIRELADRLKKEFAINAHGAGEDDAQFLATLPDHVTAKTVTDVENAKSDYTAAAALAWGELSNPHLLANKDQDRTTLKTKVGRDEAQITYLRKRETANPQDRSKTVVTHGALSVNYTSVSGVGSRGNLKAVKGALAERALKELSGK